MSHAFINSKPTQAVNFDVLCKQFGSRIQFGHGASSDSKNKCLKNKNWVTVCDKCPQINVQFKWHTFLKKNIRMGGRTHGRTNDYIMP